MDSKNKSSYILPLVGAAVLIGIAQKFGILPSAKSLQESQQAEATINLQTGPAFIKAVKQAELRRRGLTAGRFSETRLKADQAKSFAKAIYKTRGGLRPDDEAGLYSLLRRLPARTALAQVDSAFFSAYNKDLPSFFASYLNNTELAKVGAIIQAMPLGLRFLS